jgi:hypothetical protein
LKATAPAVSPSLTHIFNHAKISNFFPDDWKIARLLPLHKRGARDAPDNYRPIAILPVISKIMEKLCMSIFMNTSQPIAYFPNINLAFVDFVLLPLLSCQRQIHHIAGQTNLLNGHHLETVIKFGMMQQNTYRNPPLLISS